MFNQQNPYFLPAMTVADNYNIPHTLWTALINKESGGNPNAHSPTGAHGLTQLMPGTAAQMHVNPHNPIQNLKGGAHYLANMYQQFHSWPMALAAYNAGPGRVRSAHGVPHIAETQDYVRQIMGAFTPPKIAMAPASQNMARGGAVWEAIPSSSSPAPTQDRISAQRMTEPVPPMSTPFQPAPFFNSPQPSSGGPYHGDASAYGADLMRLQQIAQYGGSS